MIRSGLFAEYGWFSILEAGVWKPKGLTLGRCRAAQGFTFTDSFPVSFYLHTHRLLKVRLPHLTLVLKLRWEQLYRN